MEMRWKGSNFYFFLTSTVVEALCMCVALLIDREPSVLSCDQPTRLLKNWVWGCLFCKYEFEKEWQDFGQFPDYSSGSMVLEQ